jgi:hypothetical protein
VPDEQSNLNVPAGAHRPTGRRRGRRGGRGRRAPRPAPENTSASAVEEIPSASLAAGEIISPKIEASTAGLAAPEVENAPAERFAPEPAPESRRPKPFVKPADFRPAEVSAISQAVEHTTQIAEALKQALDQMEEVLELVELAERQKLADERELESLRRAMRRIQPPRGGRPEPPPPED